MRIGVIGAGIAGSLLAWRLSGRASVDLITGLPGTDATASSGGGVRGFETHPLQRRLAIDSLTELLGTLHDQAAYTETGCTYLLPEYDGLTAAVAEVEHAHPGSTTVLDCTELRRRGWHGLPEGTVGVCERRAGFIDPDRLRQTVVRRLAGGRSMSRSDRARAAAAPPARRIGRLPAPRPDRAVRRGRGRHWLVDTRPSWPSTS